MISILCASTKSNYKFHPDLDVWDLSRNAYNFKGTNPVITHAPCAQWSKLSPFSVINLEQKELAWHCYQLVKKNGGIFEHPAYSKFFQQAGIKRNQIISVDQFWFGYPCRKPTWLYFSKCKALAAPLRFEIPTRQLVNLTHFQRAETIPAFANWLIDCINASTELCDHKTL